MIRTERYEDDYTRKVSFIVEESPYDMWSLTVEVRQDRRTMSDGNWDAPQVTYPSTNLKDRDAVVELATALLMAAGEFAEFEKDYEEI